MRSVGRQLTNTRIGVVLPAIAAGAFCSTAVPKLLGDGVHPWHVISVGVGYDSHGFVRRGLVGTLVSPLVSDADDAPVIILVLASVVAMVLAWLFVRLGETLEDRTQRNALLVAAATVFAQLGYVIGHFDGLVLAVLVGHTLLLLQGRTAAAVVLLLLGGLVHEVALLHGSVLLVAASVAGRLRGRQRMAAALSVLALGGVLLVAGGFEAGHEAFMARLPRGTPTDFGDLFTRSEPWTGTIGDGVADVVYYLSTPAGQVSAVLLALAVLVTCAAFVSRGQAFVAIVSLVPTVALAAVAIDYDRWLVLHAVTGLLALVLLRNAPRVEDRGVLPLVVLLLVLGPIGVAVPLPRWV